MVDKLVGFKLRYPFINKYFEIPNEQKRNKKHKEKPVCSLEILESVMSIYLQFNIENSNYDEEMSFQINLADHPEIQAVKDKYKK